MSHIPLAYILILSYRLRLLSDNLFVFPNKIFYVFKSTTFVICHHANLNSSYFIVSPIVIVKLVRCNFFERIGFSFIIRPDIHLNILFDARFIHFVFAGYERETFAVMAMKFQIQ